MERTVRLALNRFNRVPTSLQFIPYRSTPRDTLSINLASLYHHYYLDTYGNVPPDPDPAHFEYLRFLTPTRDFRCRGDGIGLGTAARQHRSNELGQAFCRMFLHDHLGISYFAHMERVLNRVISKPFSPFRVERLAGGDTPDYLCASGNQHVFLSEAKGRYRPVSFLNEEFQLWRQQFCRVAVKKNGKPLRVKGYIVAPRFATESKPKVESGIFAEDPESPGEQDLHEERDHSLGNEVIRIHYGSVAEKLNQPLLAAALVNGFVVPENIEFPVALWEFMIPPLVGVRFVGGYYASPEGLPVMREENGKTILSLFDLRNPLRLDLGRGTFFGVAESIFRQVIEASRATGEERNMISRFEGFGPLYDSISLLRDGTILSPLEFVRFVGLTTM